MDFSTPSSRSGSVARATGSSALTTACPSAVARALGPALARAVGRLALGASISALFCITLASAQAPSSSSPLPPPTAPTAATPTTPSVSASASATVVSTRVESSEEGLQLNADFDVQLSAAMIEAVRKGVVLHFLVEFEISKGRWYWLDESVVKATRTRRVTYAPLTEQYRVTTAGVSQNVATVSELTRLLSRVRSWTVVEKGKLKAGERYDAQVRIRLDPTQLPKPFQVNALGNRDWNLASEWQRFTFVADKP